MTTFATAFLWVVLAKTSASATTSVGAGIIEVFGKLFRAGNVRILLLMALFSFAISHGFSSWLPKIFEVNGMSAAEAGWAASIPIF